MFSKLDGIFKGLPPRHVESADARLEIRRHETENKKDKKESDDHREYTPVPWEDMSYVSVASLKAFLSGVIEPQVTEITFMAAPPHPSVDSPNQRAASAYQSVGRAVHDNNIVETAPTHIETNFTEDDLARIRQFVTDLHELERRNVTELALQRSENFLDSIGASIAASLTGVT